ncbi:MAG: radical SAM protein [Anaerolineae bacterium]|jgi:hypothetical protein
MTILSIPEPYSAGVLLSYKCTSTCKHCMYACSPHWDADWLAVDKAESILSGLAEAMRGKYPVPGRVGVNDGLHFSGGEPFLNFDLLLSLTRMADRLGIPTTFVETNAFWAVRDRTTRERLSALQRAGLDGILISANPFILEEVPFERTERAVRISRDVFDASNVLIYQQFFYNQFRTLELRGTMSFREYVETAGYGLRNVELFASGRVPFKLADLYQHRPAEHFSSTSCLRELIRDWHVHIDNYGNYVPGYCAGLSLGQAGDLDALCAGVHLDDLPALNALLTDLQALLDLGKEFGYQQKDGYVSRCHLCVDVRKHLAGSGDFQELRPRAFYRRLEDS